MTSITINLSDDRITQLKKLAEQSGLTPEELLRDCVQDWLARPATEFQRAADHVLRKNAELYRRLA